MRFYATPLVASLALVAVSANAQEVGTITGKIIDSRDQQTSIGDAAIFLCDARSGRPFKKETFQILGTEGVSIQGLADMAHAVTDAKGNFELGKVPVGKYRLVAQSWLGQSGIPSKEDPPEFVSLHGVVNDVEVKAGETTPVSIRPLGKARMTLINDPEEPHAFLVLSTAARRGDPVLAFPFWGEKFGSHAIGITLMETPKVTFDGLPEGQVHAGLFNYDNNPGIGGASFTVVDGGTMRIPIYATWSNGKFDPPAGLLPLVEHLELQKVSVEELLKPRYVEEFSKGPDRNAIFGVLLKCGDETLAVEGFGEVRILDLVAADTYRSLREHHRSRGKVPAATKKQKE